MNTPIAVLLKDTHLKESNIELVTSIFSQAISLCKEKNINRIFHAGDFFTARKSQSLEVLNAANYIFKMVKSEGIDMYIVAGNHDKTDLTSERSYLDIFDNYATVIPDYSCLSINDGGINIHFLPYFKEDDGYIGRLLEISSNVEKTTKNVLITHIAVTGVSNNDGSLVENCLNKELFDPFDITFIAHYHDESWIGGKIHYFPSNYQANFGETLKKGFTILYDDLSTSFHESNFPKYIKVKLDPTDDKSIKEAQKIHQNSSDNVRFVFEGEEAELKTIDKEKYSLLGIGVEFKKDSAVPLESKDLVEKANSISFNRSNVEEAFEVFCQTKHIKDNSIGKSYLKQI